MARIAPETYKPILQFRFKVIFSAITNVSFFAKSVDLPSAENNPVTVEYGNTYMKLKGKTRWNDITMTCYAYENITQEQLWNWLNNMHQEVFAGKDRWAEEYKKDIQIQLLSPREQVVGTWTLIGAFISTVNYGNMDWGSEEVVQPEVTIAYDWARYEPTQPI
jgi:phage tail-like protein